MKWALLVIDVQKAYFDISPETARSLSEAIEYINAAIALFREKGLPVVAIQQVDEEENVVPGEPGYELPDEMDILPTDLHIAKTYGNAFTKTSLQHELEAMDVEGLILTGFCAEYCVLSTYRGAQDLDLKPILLRGSLASMRSENIPFVESINDVISYGALRSFLI